jgi:hypothetical protein
MIAADIADPILIAFLGAAEGPQEHQGVRCANECVNIKAPSQASW